MSFVPPQFKNFGKQSKDLFKKKYDFENSVKVLNKGEGCSLESGAVGTKSGEIRGYVKFGGLKCALTGAAVDGEVHTAADQESKLTLKFANRPVQGLNLTLGFSSKDKAFKHSSGSVELDYARDSFTTTNTLKSDLETHRLESQASFGVNGFAVGGAANFDLSNGAQLADANFGVNYATKKFATSLFTENNRDAVTASYFMNVNASQQVGAQIRYDLAKANRTLNLGSDFKVTDDTTARAKIEIGSADSNVAKVSTAVESRLSSPSLLLSVASSYKVTKSGVEASDIGVGFSFGDF